MSRTSGTYALIAYVPSNLNSHHINRVVGVLAEHKEKQENEFALGCKAPLPSAYVRQEKDFFESWAGQPSSPKVSVVCITYNHVKYIEQAIRGFLMQETSFPFEIIIYDDASTDGTSEIVQHYADSYPNLITAFIQKENQLSKGIKWGQLIQSFLKGEYIATCEGDDYWFHPKKLQVQTDWLENNRDYAICFHNYLWVSSDGDVLKTPIKESGDQDFSREDLVTLRGRPSTTRRPLVTMRRNVSLDAPEREKVVNGDWFTYSMMGLHGKGRYISGLCGAAFRSHAGGTWTNRPEIQKQAERIRTYLMLAAFHEREGEKYACLHFHERAARQSLKALQEFDRRGVDKLYFKLKWEQLKWKIVRSLSLLKRSNLRGGGS